MPYLDGATLAELQDRHRAIRPPRLVIAAVLDALHGLHAAHAYRRDGVALPLIHGGLTPDQLWIGSDGACRITGFGNARPRVQTRPSHRSAAATAYLAPEQLQGGAVDHRSDLFAIGVVLWNALTGKKLFHDPIDHMTMSNVLERKVPKPSAIGLCPPPALDAIVLAALDRDPERRFQSAAELAGALRDVARGAGCLASGSELAEWLAATFGHELAEQREIVAELAARPPSTAELPALPRLVAPLAPEATARDYLSLDELSRALAPVPRAPEPPPPEPASVNYPEAPPRRRLATTAAVAFAAVTCVLGWRWSVTSSQGGEVAMAEPIEGPLAAARVPARSLEVSVLEVRSLPAAAAPRVADPPAAAPARLAPAATVSPSRQAVHTTHKPVHTPPGPPAPPPRAVEIHSDPAPPPEPPKPPDAPRPALESNPYLYNK
jgi:serine/threonine-protein kinase